MTKRLSFTLLFFFAFELANAQQSFSDSLKLKLEHAKEDTDKIWLLGILAGNYQWSYPDSGIFYARKELELAKKIQFADGEIDAYQSLSESFSGKGNYPKALSLSYDIIKAHGGEIMVNSTEGEGTIFTVRMPVI